MSSGPPPAYPGFPAGYPTSYGAAEGDWLAWSYKTRIGGNGSLAEVPYPNDFGIRLDDITDGTSTTVGFAEVKAFWPCLGFTNAVSTTPPDGPTALPTAGAEFLVECGRTAWTGGVTQMTGLTFTFPPNTFVPFTNPRDGKTYDIDWHSSGSLIYAAITARSYHPGGVNSLFMDGSVRFITNSIDQATWRALGTRNGGEVVDPTKY